MATPEKLKQTWIEDTVRLEPSPGSKLEPFEIHHRYGAWPKQVEFHASRKKFVVFGGARGPGKSFAICEHIRRTMLRWPGIPILLLRKDLKDLKQSTEVEWLKVCEPQLYDPKYGGQYHKGERWYRFPNGSTLRLGELKDWESYKSMTVGMIAIDELNEVTEEAWVNLAPTLRWTTGEGVCKREECALLGEEWAREHPIHPFYQIIAGTNPAPGWVKTRFWEPWKGGYEKPNHAFISATAFDNPSLPPDYIPTLLENNTATWVQNYIYGDWSAFENMMFPGIQRTTHMWRDPIPYGQFVRVIGGIDYGATTLDAHRTAAYLVGVLSGGVKICFWEYSKQGAASADFFDAIAIATREYKVNRWEADASQHRANELLRNNDIPVFDAPRYQGAVKDGNNEITRQTQIGNDGRPELWIAETCPRLWSGIETYQLNPDTGDPAKNQQDDEVSAFRYAVMAAAKEMGGGGRMQVRSRTNNGGRVTKTSRILEQVHAERRERLRRLIAADPDL